MPRFRVVVMREVDQDGHDADVVVEAVNEAQAAAWVLRSIGGGYADSIGVSSPGDAMRDSCGKVSDVCFMYCTSGAGGFAYDVRLSHESDAGVCVWGLSPLT